MATENVVKEFTFSWSIENFSLCIQKNGQYISSPEFSSDNLGGSKWKLLIYPKGNTQSPDYISCFIYNVNLNTDTIRIYFNIEVIDAHKNIFKCSQVEDHIFKKGSNWGFHELLKCQQLVNNLDIFTDDTLTFCCHMIELKTISKPVIGIKAVTKLAVKRCSFQWCVKNPESLDWSESETFVFPEIGRIEVTLTAPEDDVQINVRRVDKTSSLQCFNSKITLLDVEGNEFNSVISLYLFDSDDGEWKFNSLIKKSKLNNEKDSLLKDSFFTLLCEFSASNGEKSEGIENYIYDIPIVDSSESVEVDTLSVLQNDLRSMFVCRKHPDVKLRAGSKKFPAHKSILSARSSVFSAMFDANMVESQTGEVDITDLDADTLESFLEFLYTGGIDKMDYESASKLLVTADKYQVVSLKDKCSTFLMTVLSDGNACEILTVADLIGHDTLKKSALDYIKVHSDKILQSPEWCQWVEKNFKLGVEVVCKLAGNIGTAKNKTSSK